MIDNGVVDFHSPVHDTSQAGGNRAMLALVTSSQPFRLMLVSAVQVAASAETPVSVISSQPSRLMLVSAVQVAASAESPVSVTSSKSCRLMLVSAVQVAASAEMPLCR